LVLKKPLLKKHVLTDYRVMRFLTGRQYQESEEAMPLARKVEMLEKASREKTPVHLIYLKQNDEKTFRTIMPMRVGEMEYQGKKYVGVRAFCLTRHEERTFRVDRILEMRV
jgi:predicted DNA-binding transcriptional regulator YafY